MAGLIVWRHVEPSGAAGRCIGRTDLPVDPRRAKRLAHRIRQWARRHRLSRVVVTSSLDRAAATGRWLARWGWRHDFDDRLMELDFGDWDGCYWGAVPMAEIDAWCADFIDHRPGGGEPVGALLSRCRAFMADRPVAVVVGHAGWISASTWLRTHGSAVPSAASWPASTAYGVRIEVGSVVDRVER